jgi:hypothetical protein
MASTCRKYPIIVINVPTPAELGILWQQSGLQALAEAIAADLRQPEIGGIIEIPAVRKESHEARLSPITGLSAVDILPP